MPLAPLELEKAFNRLKVDLAEARSVDVRLLLCARHWSDLREHRGQSQYETSLNEFAALLEEIPLGLPDLADCTLEELADIEKAFSEVGLQTRAAGTAMARARKLCFVGDIETAAQICAETHAEEIDEPALNEALEAAPSSSERALLGIAVETLRTSAPKTSQTFRGFLGDWEALSETLSYDRAHCLLVESGRLTDKPRGRLRELCGQVGPLGSFSIGTSATGASADELTFDNQLRTPDDPAVGVVYNALTAVRKSFAAGKAGRRYSAMSFRARYSITGAGGALTGGSIGLASGILAFTGLLKRETLPDERFVSGVAGVTGALDESGAVIPVNDHSFNAKARRAFFSHLKYFVVPSEQAARANLVTEELRKSHPRRRLHVIAAETLEDVLNDLNVVRSEKVPPGRYVTRKIIKYSRATKVQVPLLMAMLWVLLALLWPKLFDPTFDWNPQYVRVVGNGFEALNADSVVVWDVEYACDPLTTESRWDIGNLDEDSENEIVFIPHTRSKFCDSRSRVFAYDDNGDTLWAGDCIILNEYPGDTTRFQMYTPTDARIIQLDDGSIVLTGVNRSVPARQHIRFRSASGESLGWYINSGFCKYFHTMDIDLDGEVEVLFRGYNNRMDGCAVLFALSPRSPHGVSPPYEDPDWDLEKVKPGNQVRYVLFPKTDVCSLYNEPYNNVETLFFDSESLFRVEVTEIADKKCGLTYTFDQQIRVTRVYADDVFRGVRNSLVNNGLLRPVDWNTYLIKRRDTITYWMAPGWTTEGQLGAIDR